MDTLVFVLLHFNCSSLYSSDKCLKSLPDKFLTKTSRLEFINYMLAIKMKFLLILKAVCRFNLFGVTLIFTLNLLISCIIK